MGLEVESLADRVQKLLADTRVTTKRMFGGLTFLLNGNMLCCASPKGLMVRVGAATEAGALESPHASPCLGAGRRMPVSRVIRYTLGTMPAPSMIPKGVLNEIVPEHSLSALR